MERDSLYLVLGVDISPLGQEELCHWYVILPSSPMQRRPSVLQAIIPIRQQNITRNKVSMQVPTARQGCKMCSWMAVRKHVMMLAARGGWAENHGGRNQMMMLVLTAKEWPHGQCPGGQADECN